MNYTAKQQELLKAIENLKTTVSFIDEHNVSFVQKQIHLINSLNRLIKTNLTYSSHAIQELETSDLFNFKRHTEFELIKEIAKD